MRQAIRKLCYSKQQTMRDVADAIGMDRSNYVRAEKGERNFTLEQIIALADLYDVATDVILDRVRNGMKQENYSEESVESIILNRTFRNELQEAVVRMVMLLEDADLTTIKLITQNMLKNAGKAS